MTVRVTVRWGSPAELLRAVRHAEAVRTSASGFRAAQEAIEFTADAVVDLAALHPVRAAGSAARALLSAGKAAALLVVAHRMRRRA